jgi:putative transposase
MVFKLGIEAQKRWRRLNGAVLLEKVVIGVQFIDGDELQQAV